MRISRALALAGLGSRRKCETFVTRGSIRVNGETVTELSTQVDIENDDISYRGRLLEFGEKIYFVLFKPEGYTTTASDPHAKKTVYELLPKNLVRATRQSHRKRKRVFPVGRLDKDSEGLLLFTNDGDLANKLSHPRYEVSKWYEVRLNRSLEPHDVRMMTSGIRLREGLAKIEKIISVSRRCFRLQLKEGKNREIRRIMEKLDYTVVRLTRIAYGPLVLTGLVPGRGRYLTKTEISQLKNI